MMKQFKIAILLIMVSMLLCACSAREEEHHHITFFNNSSKNIRCNKTIGWDNNQFYCPPTGNIIIPLLISANSSYLFECPIRDNGWEETLLNSPLQIILVENEIYEITPSNDCDTIRKYVPILHCYRLTLEDLQRMNWTVVYPPEYQ